MNINQIESSKDIKFVAMPFTPSLYENEMYVFLLAWWHACVFLHMQTLSGISSFTQKLMTTSRLVVGLQKYFCLSCRRPCSIQCRHGPQFFSIYIAGIIGS